MKLVQHPMQIARALLGVGKVVLGLPVRRNQRPMLVVISENDAPPEEFPRPWKRPRLGHSGSSRRNEPIAMLPRSPSSQEISTVPRISTQQPCTGSSVRPAGGAQTASSAWPEHGPRSLCSVTDGPFGSPTTATGAACAHATNEAAAAAASERSMMARSMLPYKPERSVQNSRVFTVTPTMLAELAAVLPGAYDANVRGPWWRLWQSR